MISKTRFAGCAVLMLILPGAGRLMPPLPIESRGPVAKNDPYFQCNGADSAVAIIGCTVLIDARDSTPRVRTMALANRGIAYLNRGDPDRAIADLNRALMLDPANSTALAA